MPDRTQIPDAALEYWAQILARTPLTPDMLAESKRWLDQVIEAWSRALTEVMGSEAFAQLLGRSVDQWLAAQAPATRQLIDLEHRLRRLEDRIQTVRRAAGEPPRPRRRERSSSRRRAK